MQPEHVDDAVALPDGDLDEDEHHGAIEAPDGDNADEPPASSGHATLKYHLLGPSLTKAGQDTVDQQKVSEIIYAASKGSKFFNNESVKDKNLTAKIARILHRKAQLDTLDLTHDLRRADEHLTALELSRDLSQTIVHLDCDAFYAACEELDRPELRDVPMAVGQGVLTTCNYHARRFGCRSGMAGFVAMKLCPQLVCLPLNFAKYTAKASEVRAILADYDPRFESASIDEAYLNITAYCQTHGLTPDAAVSQLRGEIHAKTHITVSAGIAANTKLAKIASNRNKPDGQFRVPADRESILAFMADLPTRKVNGIGRVFERELAALGIETCGDIYRFRAHLTKLFGEKAFQFLMHCYLGLGRTEVHPAGEYERKSVGTESTFRATTGRLALREKLSRAAAELEEDLKRNQVKGRTLVLKIKLHTFEVLTRQTQPPFAVARKEELFRYAEPMLARLEKEIPGMTLRLLGLRCTHLVSTEKVKDVKEFFGVAAASSSAAAGRMAASSDVDKPGPNVDEDGWEIWPDAAFEEAARQETEEHMQEMEALSQEHERSFGHETVQKDEEGSVTPPLTITRNDYDHENDGFENDRDVQTSDRDEQPETWTCPICSRPHPADERSFNEHVDFCLSRQTIKQAVKDNSAPPGLSPNSSSLALEQTGKTGTVQAQSVPPKKRGRPSKDSAVPLRPQSKRRMFFG